MLVLLAAMVRFMDSEPVQKDLVTLMIEHLTRHQGFYTLVSTIVVAVATVKYVNLTARLVTETQRAATRPSIQISTYLNKGWLLCVCVKNVGNGTALDIDVDFTPGVQLLNDKEFKSIHLSALMQGLRCGIYEPIDYDIPIQNQEITYRYVDQFGQPYKGSFRLDASVLTSPYRHPEDIETVWQDIRDELESINSQLSGRRY